MTHAPFIVIDGKRYRWKDILDLRRAQLAEFDAAQYPSGKPRLFRSRTVLDDGMTVDSIVTAAHPSSERQAVVICNPACLKMAS